MVLHFDQWQKFFHFAKCDKIPQFNVCAYVASTLTYTHIYGKTLMPSKNSNNDRKSIRPNVCGLFCAFCESVILYQNTFSMAVNGPLYIEYIHF